ncbi:MAG TPA: SdrD B-like domain-containing protein [Tepidisphaeraceae bacterium]|nr:SdrD B-like domain-containing protein [Tepidisphaeraceae bacterium]
MSLVTRMSLSDPIVTVEKLEPRRLMASALVITKGGTYSGTWSNLADRDPVIVVKTAEPVVIQNSVLRGKGHLIASAVDHTDITVRNTSGYGVNPNVLGAGVGRFIAVEGFDNVRIENNYLEGTAGIHLLGYDGGRTASDTIRVVGNRARNIDGRLSNGTGGWLDFNTRTHTTTAKVEHGFAYAQFLQLDKVPFVPGIEIAWNEVVNEVGKSRVEDNISIYKSSGTAASPIRIHDNYIEGGYTLRPWQGNYTAGNWKYDWSYAGGGIMVGDGFGTTANGDPAFVKAFGNTVVSTTNYGIATSAGHDTEIYLNRVVSSGKLPDGRAILGQNVGIFVWDSYDKGATRFHSNTARDNTAGWVKGAGRNDWWSPHPGTLLNNVHYPGTITRATELAEAAAWRAKRYPAPAATGNIAGTVFKDADGDGARDATDGGQGGFTVFIDSDNDAIRDSTEPTSKSTSTGRYQFSALKPGKYVVRILSNAGWRVSTPASASLTVTGGQTATRNFGVSTTPIVSGTVFMDADKDAAFDALESGLSNWTVYVDKDNDGTLDAGETRTITDASGKYALIGLAVGTHRVRVVPQANYRLTTPTLGYHIVTLASGSVLAGRNFGEKRL